MSRNYTDLMKLQTFKERFMYLKLNGVVGEDTFGWDRYMNQILYKSRRWFDTRNKIILRDNGCDLGIPTRPIDGRIVIHHMVPITAEDIENESDILFDPENLITTSLKTHNAIHYGDESILFDGPVIRRPNDTCPWKD